MTSRPRPRADEPASALVADTEPADTSIVERPDGFYWVADDGRQEIGPFPSFSEAERDMSTALQADAGPGETLAEAESELGIADWIDPETGLPAEEQRPRIEDH
jgi:hypothetical protein